MQKNPILSIIILNYKSADFCDKCLQAISTFSPSCSYEILVVDNASHEIERWRELKEKWLKKLNVSFSALPNNIGYGKGNEYAIRKSHGKYFAIVNPDIEVLPGTFDGLLEYIKNHENVGIVAPKLLYSDGKIQDSFRLFPNFSDLFVKRIGILRHIFQKKMEHFLMWKIDLSSPIKVDWVVGAFFLARRKAWEEVGGFDPRYFLFLEDTDVCRSLWKKGWKVIFHPHFSAYHHHERLSDAKNIFSIFRNKMLQIHLWSAIKYFWKWKGKR
ncbi:glycosyltransferase family 2 protein [Candidatus Peregrinibacteria bacterium]|nr:glycosyltransferase family 2 protein [Candidatus Peregrinibacteria bacterium]